MAQVYDNTSISQLKGADRVRLRPSVIFGSDDLRGAQQSFFEILSNSIDEAREGHGHVITVTRFNDDSIDVKIETVPAGCYFFDKFCYFLIRLAALPCLVELKALFCEKFQGG